MDQVPQTIGGLLTWLASGAGVGLLLTWLSGLSFWSAETTDSPIVKFIKSLKTVLLIVIGSALGIGAALGTQYIPAGLLENIDPYYKIVWTVVIAVAAMNGGNLIVLRARNYKARLLTAGVG